MRLTNGRRRGTAKRQSFEADYAYLGEGDNLLTVSVMVDMDSDAALAAQSFTKVHVVYMPCMHRRHGSADLDYDKRRCRRTVRRR